LYKKKLINLKNNILDRRQKDVVINDLGLDLLTRIEANSSFFDTKIKHISLEEVRIMNDLLDKLRGTETATVE
jgi:DNA-binding MarR family transcriptional regulator